jgi:hypothetical protein
VKRQNDILRSGKEHSLPTISEMNIGTRMLPIKKGLSPASRMKDRCRVVVLSNLISIRNPRCSSSSKGSLTTGRSMSGYKDSVSGKPLGILAYPLGIPLE